MNSNELRAQLAAANEKESIQKMVEEYIRVRKIVMDSGELTFDECTKIAGVICEHRHVFDSMPWGY